MPWNGVMPAMPAAARLFVVAMMLACASAGAAEDATPQLIYGGELMSAQERERYRQDEAGVTGGGRQQFRERHRERMQKRARDKGVRLRDPEGVVERAPPRRAGAAR